MEPERGDSILIDGERIQRESTNVRTGLPLRPKRREQELIPRRLLFHLFPSFGILFISTLFWVVLESKRKEKAQLSLTNQNLETEMKFLKSQMNPHFLFNALNNIYALSQQGHTKTSQLILKLSSMLRFIVYETDGRKIPIGQEVDYINDFIEFQKIKLDFDPNLEVTLTDVDYQTRIEPMLIFPFVENAFKHGNIDDHRYGWVKMKLKASGGLIFFQISNSKPLQPVSKDRLRGIGIENVRKRLSVLYDNRYQLDISETKDVFEVKLFIDTL
ncbi:sensor histidine kinase [Marinilabilia salmonicolor]|nr:histidine kinase [Marinilabilia salmonicolor]